MTERDRIEAAISAGCNYTYHGCIWPKCGQQCPEFPNEVIAAIRAYLDADVQSKFPSYHARQRLAEFNAAAREIGGDAK